MNTVFEALELNKLVKSAKDDPLKVFVAQGYVDRLREIKEKNLNNLFTEAKKFKVRYIYIGKYEICGCEDKKDTGGTWSAIWSIARNVGFPGSCGNSDQYQCNDTSVVFPDGALGGWDINENRKLTDKEVVDKKFRIVVEYFRGKK